jgi:aminoglycoside 6'-N-acetyltransferase I
VGPVLKQSSAADGLREITARGPHRKSAVGRYTAGMMVREYQARDRDELERLVRLMFPDAVDECAELLARPGAVFVVQRDDGKLGGYVEAGTRPYGAGCDTSPVAYIEAWYVDEDLRRRRWGAQLLAAVESWARRRGLSELASDAPLGNTISIAAQKSFGLREIERVVCFAKRL